MKYPANLWRWGLFALVMLGSFSARANPIEIPEQPLTPEIAFLISFSIFLEAACISLLLRHFRKPRLFILWILALHLITYPGFLSLLWLLPDLRPALAVALGEALVVAVEGTLIYWICRRAPSRQKLPRASLVVCWRASLVGNVCSLMAFPCLLNSFEFLSRHG